MSEPAAPDARDEALIRLVARVADGEPVDWEREGASTPDIVRNIPSLRCLEDIAIAGRAGYTFVRVGDTMALPPREPPPPEPIDLAPGTTWGPFTIIERIGAGGAGDVYRARDSGLDRDVALKLWRETETRKTSGTEARRLAKVRHTGILTVHGSARFDGYIGMWTDMVLGRNLEELLEAEGPLDVAEACRIGIAVCDSLEAMHREGLVHRDVKTSNVMREPGGRVVLMDFGSVKELPRGVPEHTRRMRGTPRSMAPEALRGERIGPAADVYGLGVLLYRLVSGRDPIEAKSIAELIDAHQANSRVPLRERCANLPAAFEQVVERALDTDPAKRPKSMQAFRRALEAVGRVRAGWLRRSMAASHRLMRRMRGGPPERREKGGA